MKASFKFLLTLMLAILATGCMMENSTATNTDAPVGIWSVSSFQKGDSNLTNQFASYTVTCSSNGSILMQNGEQSYRWNWNYNSGCGRSACRFKVSGCASGSSLWNFEDDWSIQSSDSQTCCLTSRNPNNACKMIWTKKSH